jgi:putative ABC transport system permease protein
LLLAYQPNEFRTLSLKVAKGAEQSIISRLEKTWKKLYPNQPFDAQWFDKQLYQQHLHKDDLMFIGLLTTMSLSIACLGLLGMVIYTTNNRSKEVGIRRVMGAKVWQVIFTISKEFMGLLVLSVCIGLPLGFLVGTQFLQQYAYRIPVSFGILAGSAAALLRHGSFNHRLANLSNSPNQSC